MKPLFGKKGLTITEHRKVLLHWLALGKDNASIGLIMGLSKLTIKNHIQDLSLAYGVNGGSGNRLKIVMAALVHGDLKLEDYRDLYQKCIEGGRLRRK